jgi:glycosyltransferase involved in cell wall biosynthesis
VWVQEESDSNEPLVSIGLPVYNGENYLAKAIDSVLGQTLRDLELIICDNASTDRTQAICEGYAQRDERVHYIRNERNLGAGPNYDLAFHSSRGTFFNWLAHDDAMAPSYLEKAVARLERNPDAVLCYMGITEIGPKDEIRRTYANHLPGVDTARPSVRLAGMILNRHQCEPFFGLFRREALIGSGLHGVFCGSDRALLAEMALRGPCVTVPEPLFLHREHSERYTRAVLLGDRTKAESWQDTNVAARRRGCSMYYLSIYIHYWRIVRKTIRERRERQACYGQLVRWWVEDYHLRDVVKDVLNTIHPRLLTNARRFKRSLFGISPAPPGSLPPLVSPDRAPENPPRESVDTDRTSGDTKESQEETRRVSAEGRRFSMHLQSIRAWILLICGGGGAS